MMAILAIVLMLGGLAALVAGVHIVAGLGWALVAGGWIAIMAGHRIAKDVTDG